MLSADQRKVSLEIKKHLEIFKIRDSGRKIRIREQIKVFARWKCFYLGGLALIRDFFVDVIRQRFLASPALVC